MSVQDGLIFAVSAAGVADGPFPGAAADDRHDGGRSGGMKSWSGGSYRRQADFGPVGRCGGGGGGQVRGRTLRNQPGDQGRCARAVDRRRQDPRAVLASGRGQDDRSVADLADWRLEAALTSTTTITRDKTYATTAAAATTVRINTSTTTSGVGRYYRDITVQPLGRC